MKKVKFNCTTSVLMISDEELLAQKNEMIELKKKDYTAYRNRLVAGHEHEMRDVKIGDILEVPEWYYIKYKDTLVPQGVSFDHYTDLAGGRIPYDTREALKHRDISSLDETMKKVKIFDLIK